MPHADNALLTVSNTRLYGGAIAVVAGLYAVVLAMVLTTTAAPVEATAWLTLALGLVIIAHGFLLLTPFAERALGSASGALMIIYGVLLLAAQGWLAWEGQGPTAAGEGALATVGWAAGVVALSLLLLANGAILATRRAAAPVRA